MKILLGNDVLLESTQSSIKNIKIQIETLGLSIDDFYILQNGKKIQDENLPSNDALHLIPRVLGGKGGFGSMLRAIGAQIEKTTNREACRDLSGRRLRDINEEQRLKDWIAKQADREREAIERKKKKLEKLCHVPKHEFHDEEYDKERLAIPEKVEDAVLQGLQASTSGVKRKMEDCKKDTKKKKLWIDDDLDELSSDEDDNDGVSPVDCSSKEVIKSDEKENINQF